MDIFEKIKVLFSANRLWRQFQELLQMLKKGGSMTDLKTTIAGLIAGISQLVKLFDIDIPQPILDAVSAVALMLAFFFAKDKDK